MRKKVISDCCNAPVHHYPTMGLDPMQKVIFFCDKCGKSCKTLIMDKKHKEIK